VTVHHRYTNAKFWVVCGEGFLARKQMATRVLWSINNLEVQGSQLWTKRNLIRIFIIVMKSGAPLLGLAKSIYYGRFWLMILLHAVSSLPLEIVHIGQLIRWAKSVVRISLHPAAQTQTKESSLQNEFAMIYRKGQQLFCKVLVSKVPIVLKIARSVNRYTCHTVWEEPVTSVQSETGS